MEQKTRKLNLRGLKYLLTVAVLSLSTYAFAAVNFKTLEAWQSPRLYYFFKISEDLSSVSSIGAAQNTSLRIPFQKMNAACEGPLRLQDLRVVMAPDQEVLLSSDRGWLAVRVKEASSGSEFSLRNIELENHVSASAEPCLLRINWASLNSRSRQLLLPSIVFSGAEHRFSGQEFRVREDFVVAAIRYRIEASSGLRRLTVSDESIMAPMLGARGNFWINRLGYLGADFQILQSIQSFPKDLANAEWAFALSSRFYWSQWDLAFTLMPHLGLRQQLLLSEVDVSLPQNSRSISLFQAGATMDIEFAERWLLRGRGEYGFKEFSRLATSNEDWAYWAIDMAVGYRLRAELRLLLEAGVHNYSRATVNIRKFDLMRFGIELDF